MRSAAAGVFGNTCGIKLSSIGGTPKLGNALYSHTIAATGATTTNCLFVLGVKPLKPFNMGIALPPLSGCQWYVPFDVQALFPTAKNGTIVLPGGVPNVPGLAGLKIDTQVLGAQGSRLLQSNAVSHVLEIN